MQSSRTPLRLTSVSSGSAYREWGSFSGCKLTAITFVEAYLNGIAADHYFANADQLSESTKGLLLDWDFLKGRPKFLSTRDKILQYQRIILNCEHAQLQESNFPELAHVVTAAKSLRDALVHPAPDTHQELAISKQHEFIALKPDAARTTIDNAISLVQQLTRVLYGNQNRLFWLIGRGSNGIFPSATFA